MCAEIVDEQAGKEEKRVRKTSDKRTIDKWKKKKWYTIVAPKEFDSKEIGETPVEKIKLLEGRIINSNLGDLTAQRQKRHISISFKINKVEGLKAYTTLVGHQTNISYLGRVIRRRSSKIETVQNVTTKDKKTVKIKTVAITARRAKNRQKTAIRHMMVDLVSKAAKKKEYSQFMQEVIFGAVSSKIFNDAKKIFPLKRVEIVKSRIIAE